ncbi:MAG: 4Fe-4S binding protein [Clostridia bacterium]|nr:4Fe-4S binding protein [Clostridia bacterium]
MKKIINWIKAHLPTKRKLIQVYAALLFNANLKGFKTGQIYTGPLKNICTPGLNCYSCPGASGACPLGALQNSLSASGKTAPYYVFGIIMLYGLLFGRWICGFLCPFGLIQELLHKIPTPKVKKGRVSRAFSFLKYVILVFFVFIIPLAYATRNFPLPGFCKYICPAGTLEGAMGLLSNSVNESYLRMLGPLFTWKFLLMISFLVASVFIFRFFCRFLCPLGALYGLFNKISLVGVTVDKKSCIDCGICVNKCKMDIHHVGDIECINCGECISACPTKAISWKGSKFMLNTDAEPLTSSNATETEKDERQKLIEEKNARIAKRNNVIKTVVAILMVVFLAFTLIYYNFIDGREDTPTPPADQETETSGETADETVKEKPPVGTKVGNTCPDITLPLIGKEGSFSVQENAGKVTVLNFWYTTCTPCLDELPHFYEVAAEYKDEITLVATHIDWPGLDIEGWLETSSGHPEWTDGTMIIAYDEGKLCQNMFKFMAFPTTVVIDADGVITDVFVGGLTKDELVSAVEKALN